MTAETGMHTVCVCPSLHHKLKAPEVEFYGKWLQLIFLEPQSKQTIHWPLCTEQTGTAWPLTDVRVLAPSLDPDWAVMELISLKLWGCLGVGTSGAWQLFHPPLWTIFGRLWRVSSKTGWLSKERTRIPDFNLKSSSMGGTGDNFSWN